MKRDVWEGILLRHGLVEKAEDKTQVAVGQAYLCHLDRDDLIEEVKRLWVAEALRFTEPVSQETENTQPIDK